MAGTLVAEALARGDMGLAVAALAPGAVATALVAVGHRAAAGDLPPGVHRRRRAGGRAGPERAARRSSTCSARRPRAAATATSFVLDGREVAGPARRRGRAVRGRCAARRRAGAVPRRGRHRRPHRRGRPRDGAARGVDDPARRSTASGCPAEALLGATDGSTYTECVRLVAARVVRARGRHRPGGARLRHAVRQGARGVRRADRPPPVGRVHGRRHRHRAAGDAAGHLEGAPRAPPRARTSPARSALARTLCADKGMRIGLDGVQLLGGHGYVKEHPVERWYRDLRAVGVMEGTVLV